MQLFMILTTAVLLAAQSVFSAPFIVNDGEATAQIVIDEHAIRTQRLAARELQRYVKKISGAELPIVTVPSNDWSVSIYVGDSAYTQKLGIDGEDLKYGAYRIVSGEDWLALVGHDSEFTPIEPWPRSRGESASDEFQQAWDNVANGHHWICPIRNMWRKQTR